MLEHIGQCCPQQIEVSVRKSRLGDTQTYSAQGLPE